MVSGRLWRSFSPHILVFCAILEVWNFSCWWQLLLTFLKLVFKMTLYIYADRKILHSGDQLLSLGTVQSIMCILMDVSGNKHSFKATDLESKIWLSSFKVSGFEANEGSAAFLLDRVHETVKQKLRTVNIGMKNILF